MENYEAVRKALLANRANTLALLGCLRETLEERPFREAEEALAGSRAMALTTQTPHALYAMLLKCGAVEAIEVSEESDVDANGSLSDGTKAPEVVDAADGGEDVGARDPLDDPCSDLPDQPVDYMLRTTEIGRAVLDELEPAKRFSERLAAEPDGYGDAYDRVLALCETGASKADIEEALAGHAALSFPKQIYPGYFISKLETVDGISWDGTWRTTEAGRRMRALLA